MGTIRNHGEALFLLIIFFLVLILLSGNGMGDDPFEENDDLAHAYPLEPGVYPDLNASDPDFFSINCTTSGVLRITLWYEGGIGDLALLLFSENGTELMDSDSQGGEERVEIDVLEGERFFFEVRNGTDIEYHMAVVNGNEDSWIFSVFMDGDNTLHDNMEPDLVEMREAGSGGGLHIPVLKDGEGSNDTVVVYVMQGYDIVLPACVVNQSWGNEINMGDPETLADWLTWCVSTFDTRGRTALDLWDHGKGVWGCCWDSNSGNDLLTLEDIREGIERSGVGRIERSGAGRIELLGSDSCLMQVLELSHEVVGLANYFIASQEDEPKDGWDYAPFLRELSGNLSLNGEQLGRSIIKGYIAEYGEDGDETLSVIDLKKVPMLVSSLENLSRELRMNVDLWADEIRAARDDTRDYNYYYVDLLDFSGNLERRTDNKTILGLVAEVIRKTTSAILHEEHGAKRYNSNGLSVYFPKSGYKSDYDDISFGMDTGWGEFLRDWIETPGGPTDHFDRVLFYPGDNDSYPGNDTLLVKFKPFSDTSGENVIVLFELINETGVPVSTHSLNLTLYEDTADFTDNYIQLDAGYPIGNYAVRISLFDSHGNRDDVRTSDPFRLHPFDTAPPKPSPPTIAINPDAEFPLLVHEGETLHLILVIYSGIPTSFSWDLDGDNISDLITSSPMIDHTFVIPGEYECSVNATDDWNQSGEDRIMILVNAIPTITFHVTSILANPGKVDLIVEASDIDGDIVWYEWDLDGDEVYEESSDYQFPTDFYTGVSGDFIASFRVVDSDGATTEKSLPIHINYPPRINSYEVHEQPGGDGLYLLSVDAEDRDGEVVSYRWDQGGEGIFVLETESNVIDVSLSYGMTIIVLEITDDMGLTNQSSFEVFIPMAPEISLSTGEGILITTNNITHQGKEPLELELGIIGFFRNNSGSGKLEVTFGSEMIYSSNFSMDGEMDEIIPLTLDGSEGSYPLVITFSNDSLIAKREVTITFENDDGQNGPGNEAREMNDKIVVSLVTLVCAVGAVVIITFWKKK